ncbi:MAG: response regulator [Myxococcota bacterium]|nr:response regulator [Myxococcota bacterium]
MALTKERLEQLVEHSSDVVVGTDRKGVVVYYNDGAEEMLGYAEEEILGEFVGKLYPSVDEAKRVKRAMAEDAYGGIDTVTTFRTTFLSKSGEEIPVAISGTLLRDEHGEDDGTIGFAKDMREVLEREQLDTLGQVAIGLSHEIRSPLAVILNQAEMLESDLCELAGERDVSVETERLDAVRREIGRISETLDRLGQMVRDESYETVDYVGPARMVDLRKREAQPTGRDPRLEGLRILVADDDGGICRSMKEILEHHGCQVVVARDGADALAKAEARDFDAVLSDVVMPGLDGYELFQALRKVRPSLPVLMMTGFHYDKDHIIKRSKVAGLGTVIFKKPVDPMRLRDALAQAVGRDDKPEG